MNLTPGASIHKGKYILETQLGRGFFSLTYRAISKSGQTVVLKTLAESLCQHPNFDQFKQQFLRFAQKLRHCKHPHLVSVLDYFEEAERPYLVMEYIPGQTLAQIIQSQVLPERQALKYIHQVGEALSHLHQFGLLHRDIKPQNIIWRQDSDCVVLCELGITCELTPGAMQTHASLLSSGYVPPEQYSPDYQRTKATDIYALAATFYCLLTGHPPLPVPVRKVLQAANSNCLFPSDAQQSRLKISPEAMQAISCGLELAVQKRTQTVEAWLASIPLPKKLRTPREIETLRQKDTLPLKSSYSNQGTLLSSPSAQKQTGQQYEYGTQTIKRTLRKPKVPKKVVLELSLKKLPLKALLMTGAIAASVGVGFGFALRFNGPDTPGSTILHTEQSFPPRSDWPVSEPSL